MSKSNRSFINMISGGLGYIAPTLVNLVSTPILIQILGEASFGLQSLFNVIIGYFMVADMGMDIPITKFVAENNIRNEHIENSKLLSSTFQIYFAIGSVGVVLFYLLSTFFSNRLFSVPDHLTGEAILVFKIAGLGFFFSTINMWGRAALNGLHRYDLSNGINTTTGVLGTITGLGTVYYGYGVVGFVFCKVAFSCISSLFFIILIKRKIYKFNFSLGINLHVWDKIKVYLSNGIVIRVSGMILGKMDQTLIGVWLGVALAGVYSIPFLIPSTLCYFIASIFTFMFPIICELHAANKKKELKDLFINYSRLLAILSSIIFFPLFLFGDKFLILWVGELIAEKTKILFLLLSAAFLSTILTITLSNLFIIGIGQMKLYTRFTLIKGLICLIGLLLLIKPIGINGAGVAILVASICDFAFFLIAIKYYLVIDFKEIGKVYLKPLLCGIILSCFFFLFRSFANNWLGFTLVNFSFVLFYLIAISSLKLISSKEKAFLLNFFQAISKK